MGLAGHKPRRTSVTVGGSQLQYFTWQSCGLPENKHTAHLKHIDVHIHASKFILIAPAQIKYYY